MLDNNNLMTPNLLINDESLTSAKLDVVLRTLKLSLKTSAKGLDIAFTDLNQSLGFLPADIYRKIDALLNDLENKAVPNAIDLISLGELLGEFNAFARYSNKLRYQQSMEAKINKVAKVNKIKSQAYFQTVKVIYKAILHNDDFTLTDNWAVLSAVDEFLRMQLNPKQQISMDKAIPRIASFIGLTVKKGRRSKEQIYQKNQILSYLCNVISSSNCYLTYTETLKYERNEAYGYEAPVEDKRLTALLSIAEELSNHNYFNFIKEKLSLSYLCKKLLSVLAKKYLVNKFDPLSELVFTSELSSYFYQLGIREISSTEKGSKLSIIQSGRLDEVLNTILRKQSM